MRIDRIKALRFMTFMELDYIFQNTPLFVVGENLTDDNQQTNGVGKSAIAAIVEFCIYASNSRGITDADLVNFDHKDAETELFASCDIRKERLHIHWLIKKRGSNVLTLKKQYYGSEEWSDVDYGSTPDGKKYIADWFSIQKDDFFNYYVISQKRFKSFFESPNSDKVALMNRFSDLSIIEGLGVKEKEEIESLQKTIKALEESLITIETQIKERSDSLAYEEERDLKKEQADKVEALKSRISKIEENNANITSRKGQLSLKADDLHKQLEKVQKELTTANTELENFKMPDFSAYENKFKDDIKRGDMALKSKNQEIYDLDESIIKANSLINGLKAKLAGVIKCPKCSHEFIIDKEYSKEQAEELLIKTQSAIKNFSVTAAKLKEGKEAINKALEGIEAKIRRMNNKLTEESRRKQTLSNSVNEIQRRVNRLLTDSENVQADIVAEKKAEERNNQLIKQLKEDIKAVKVDNSQRISELNNGILSAKEDLKLTEEKLKIKRVELHKYNQWIENFKLFKMDLANKSLEVVEYHLNRYLEKMGVDIRVRLEGQKMKANGDIKEEINAVIVRNHDRKFGTFSGGEKGRLIFASVLANKYMIDEVHPYGGLDFLIMDELFEGVDPLGLAFIMKSVEECTYPILAITHVTDEHMSADTLKIIKENGISRINKVA